MYKINDIVKCVVTGFKPYGIFVKIDDEYDGLIHISEISEGFVKNVQDYCNLKETLYVKVIGIDEENKHLKLSIKDLNFKLDGSSTIKIDENGFLPLKNKLDLWVNEKIKKIKEEEKNK